MGNGIGVFSSVGVTERVSNCAHLPFPHTALSSWNLVEMNHFERGTEDGEKKVFFSRGHCSLWHGCQGGDAFPGYLAQYLPYHRCGMFVLWTNVSTEISLTYSQPSTSMGSAPTESVNQMENIWKRFQKVPKNTP